ncbi:putative glutamate-1-semialdehyde 2,1-aminomutase [Exophiala viscosa]|uniref:putative glutamate-1-semialdehyde 2,1-aminomutase n=1 Tax=Exophiala viscosa TaxID=2486360 RepID=UPI0021960D17|nr:putative glutamate-1-semialdehyde 2,1-aminomutase [Exophiala viscosa]
MPFGNVTLRSSADLETLLDQAKTRFAASNKESALLYDNAVQYLPGGNTRSALHTAPFPVHIKQGKGTTVTTADGAVLTDLVGELSAGLYGHSDPLIRSVILETFDTKGMCLGATTANEAKHAQLICERFNLERVRFTNSGTEANLFALLAARSFTGRDKVVMFNSAYHGGVLMVMPDGTMPLNMVDRDDKVILRYNDLEDADRFFASEQANDVAAVLVEPMQGGGGALPGDHGFLRGLQQHAHKAGALFIIDEVMTSRLAPGGLKSTIPGLKPDLTILGKYLGGGFAFGAFGGRAEVMETYDPRNGKSLLHMGTFNQNTMSMNAGFAGLSRIFTADVCVEFNETGDRLRKRLNEVSSSSKLGFTGLGSLISAHTTEAGVREAELKSGGDHRELLDVKDLFWFEMLEEGFWMARRGAIALMLGTPQEELDRFVDAVDRFVKRHEHVLKLEVHE